MQTQEEWMGHGACTCLKMNVMVKYRNKMKKSCSAYAFHKRIIQKLVDKRYAQKCCSAYALAKRHDLTKSQISMQIYQNHATRHDLVHSLYHTQWSQAATSVLSLYSIDFQWESSRVFLLGPAATPPRHRLAWWRNWFWWSIVGPSRRSMRS